MATAMFGAGCFWGIEVVFRRIPGVTDVTVGYSGGAKVDPTYEDVCTGRSGHAEVVQIVYDPGQVSFDKLLDAFWACHDPTQMNRQGPDIGTQYRSVIFTMTLEQETAATAAKARLDASGHLDRKVATEITPAGPFYAAEGYHQRYLEKRGLAHCTVP